jgi:adenosylcobyric acid synthase
MSNNAAVCPDGSEIGRAQAVQALAAGIPLCADLNPILIKPEADTRSQVIVMGRPFKTLAAASYYEYKETLWGFVTSALDRLRAEHELIIVEGAGSPVELNLKAGDIVNMAVARYAESPVLIVGDIDRGGIFAQLLGTLWLLEPQERALVRGVLVNKFRGDMALFEDGVRILEEIGGVPVLGVIPYIKDLRIPEEDAVALENASPYRSAREKGQIDIAVIHLPRISNFDDFDPLSSEIGVRVRYIQQASLLGEPDAIVLPGTKSTAADLAWLRENGFEEGLRKHIERGGALVGICGGYQMMGRALHDPGGVESQQIVTPGLGLLPVETEFIHEKATYQVQARVCLGPGWLKALEGEQIAGYEIHMGRTQVAAPWLEIERRSGEAVRILDGAASSDGRIWGCYLHGIFNNPNFRSTWLNSLGWAGISSNDIGISRMDTAFDRLADAVETALDMPRLEQILWES